MASSTMDAVEANFGQRDLYAILGVKASATPAQLKTAYRKKALKYHPDKNPNDDDATTKFQLLCTIHAALSNPELRAVYDETGELETEATETSSFRDWVDYWRNLFPKVTTKDIQSFEKTYRESDEEAQDVLQAYEKYKGKMQSILDVVMLSTDDDIDRFTKIIQDAIDANEVPLYPAFTKKIKTKGKSKKAAAEAKAAEELFAQIRGNQAAALSKRQQGFASLLAKYADEKPTAKSGTKKKKARDDDDDEPSEAAFQAAQQRLLHKKKKTT